MAFCFKALATQPGLELMVVAGRSGGSKSNSKFNADSIFGFNARLLGSEERSEAAVAGIVTEFQPDVVSLPGWGTPYYRRLAFHPALKNAIFLMVMDTPRNDSWRQKLGKYRFASYFARISKVAAAGERAFQCAKAIGFEEGRISRGAAYGIDYDLFYQTYSVRTALQSGWPKRFLFTGRYHPTKAIDVLMKAYSIYRESVKDPWPLTTCGSGPMEAEINSTPGVENMGFVQPQDQPDVYARHGVFVLASRFEPWAVVIAEACAAGLPVVCTEACGATVELVRSHYNGLTVATEDAGALARAFRYMHDRYAELPEMGRRGMALAAPFAAEIWARRWLEMIDETCPGRRFAPSGAS